MRIPLGAGGRLTGRVGAFGLGALNLQAEEAASSGARSTNFTVLLAKREILRRSSVGVMFAGRSVSQLGVGSSEAYGVDGVFGFFDEFRFSPRPAAI